MSKDPRGGGEASEFLSRISSIQVVVAAIAAQLLPLFLAWQIATPLANALALLLTLAIIGAAYLLWRRGQKHRADLEARESRAREWASRPLQAAFRGLYSYTRHDELPGRRRRQLAKRIATQVAHPTFGYGVVSGEIGAGKSSLLDSGVGRELENGGFSVVLIRGLQGHAPGAPPASLFQNIRKRLEECTAEPVLIFDQFEEALIAWPSAESRREIGAFLRQPLHNRSVRVVCGLRSDYILALHDLTGDLPDPTSSKILFPVKNLDEAEASEVILECAERDGLVIDAAFAKALAADLSHDGKVRPPELQLVCLALETSEPERSYRLKGGSEGILSAYVEDAVANTSAPEISRLILRALCNFAALPPAKTQPKNIEEISQLLPNAPPHSRMEDVVRHLIAAGLLALIADQAQKRYALVHDYLVQPISIATSDATTETERATQLLRLHLTEYSTDKTSRIPRHRLRLIRRHADRELLGSASAEHLIALSSRAARIRTVTVTAISLLALMFSGYVFVVRTLEKQQAVMRAHLEERQQRYREAREAIRREVLQVELERVMMEIRADSRINPEARERLLFLLQRAQSRVEP